MVHLDSIYEFLLVSNSNYMSKSLRLGVIATQKLFSYLISLGQNFGHPTRTLNPGPFFSKSNLFFLGSQGRLPPKMKLIGCILFVIFCPQTQTDKRKETRGRHAKHGQIVKVSHLNLGHTDLYTVYFYNEKV